MSSFRIEAIEQAENTPAFIHHGVSLAGNAQSNNGTK